MQPENLAGRPYPPPVELLAGRYRMTAQLLGRGALADVWAGRDEVRGRPVAVKMFRPGTETAEKQRFAREARTLSGLSHPHLISLYDAGEAEGRAYLVMRQMPGGTLGSEIRLRGSLPVDTVRRIGAQVASALAYIHGRGIVHRDVKPANILLDSDETAVLADFGIARLIDGTRLTSTGVTVGTAAYLSPEQVRGRQVGPAADVYALGLVLMEALTGQREYPGEPIEAAVARLYREPAVPENLPGGLTGLLRTMTADDPSLRPPASHICEVLGRRVPAVPSQIRAVALTPTATADTMPISVHHHRRRVVWLAPAGLAIAVTAGVFALRGPASADASRPTGRHQAPATSTVPASSSPRTSSSAARAGRPAVPAAASSTAPAPLPQQLINVAAISTGHAFPPAQAAPRAQPPGHAKGHKGGHGHGKGNGHNRHG